MLAVRPDRESLDDVVGVRERFVERAATAVDGASLAVVRMVFGLVGVFSSVRLLVYGWAESLYAGPAHRFHYPLLVWLPVPAPLAMRALVATVGIAALLVALGLWYRATIAVFVIGFTWIELLDVATYLNHYWFMTLVGTSMLFLPMAAVWSVDARRRGETSRGVPVGAVWLLRAQLATVYLFAGVAKLHADWLVHGLPLRLWLPAHGDLPIVGGWLAQPSTALALSWAGALFDLTIVGFLLWRRTRVAAWLVVVAFHVTTWLLFPIGVFPWLMIGMTTIFFAPDWPRRLLRQRAGVAPAAPAASARHRWLTALAVAWIGLQVALPLRHHLYLGDARWTGEGFRFSWNVLALEKSGDVSFRVTDRLTGRTWLETGEELYTGLQWRTMASDPELIRQAAHAIAAQHHAAGRDVEVRVDAFASLNGREAQRLIDPAVDLAHEPWRLGAQAWILPFDDTPPP